jgi:hypothetical protein
MHYDLLQYRRVSCLGNGDGWRILFSSFFLGIMIAMLTNLDMPS